MMNLEMSRIKDYLKIIAEKDGIHVCNDVAQYVFVVLAQFLQIVVPIPSTIVTNFIALIDMYYDSKYDTKVNRCITTSTRVDWTW